MTLVIIFFTLLSIWLRPPSNNVSSNQEVPGLTATENNTAALVWVKELLNKYSHESETFSGIEAVAGNPTEIWIIGRKVENENRNSKIIGVENNYGKFFAKLIDNPVYSSQNGDTFNSMVKTTEIDPEDVRMGDFIAIRSTYLDNFGLAVEVRLLIR